MNDMMNLRRHGDHDGRRGECEELEYPFFEGDGSSFGEWEDYGVADDDYEEAPVFDDDQYEDVIEKEKGFVDTYLNFQEDENNVSFSGVVLGVEEESMPVYDTDIEDVIDGEEDNMENVVVVANDLCSSKIQTTVSIKPYLRLTFHSHKTYLHLKSEDERHNHLRDSLLTPIHIVNARRLGQSNVHPMNNYEFDDIIL
ncbi:hypothetical protein Tco_1467433 [Tanacetum coccineum]